MACELKEYGGVGAEKMEQIRQELRKMGLTVPDADLGKITNPQFGVEAEFHWNRSAETISVQVHKKPIFLPCSVIYSKLEETITKPLGG